MICRTSPHQPAKFLAAVGQQHTFATIHILNPPIFSDTEMLQKRGLCDLLLILLPELLFHLRKKRRQFIRLQHQ